VTGPQSIWNNWGEVDLGVNGSGNRVDVLNGAAANGNFVLGSASTASSNNVMTVSDPGSTVTGNVTVGNSGIQNHLQIRDGASAQLGGVTISYLQGSTNNSMSIDRASVTADTVNVGFYGYGDLILNRGTFTVNWLYQNLGNFYFNGGVVNAAFSQANLVVGDQIQPARLNLTGSFHHGVITVSSNGWLTGLAAYVTTGYGLGGIENNVTNYGTISPGNPVGEMSILYANLALKPSSTVIFNLQGTNQGISYSDILVTYNVQFAGTLRVRLLNGYRPSSNDVFTLMTFNSSSGAFANGVDGSRIKTSDGLGSFQVGYSGTAFVLSNYQTTDADGDGIDDAWALQYFGHTPLSDAEKRADADGDGLSNYDEFLAGTDPTNAASDFRITSVTTDPSGVITLKFNAVDGKTYHIDFSDDLASWNSVQMPLLAWTAPGTYQWIDDGTETGSLPHSKRFYRVIVTP
jgi:hypothetical protein